MNHIWRKKTKKNSYIYVIGWRASELNGSAHRVTPKSRASTWKWRAIPREGMLGGKFLNADYDHLHYTQCKENIYYTKNILFYIKIMSFDIIALDNFLVFDQNSPKRPMIQDLFDKYKKYCFLESIFRTFFIQKNQHC